MSSVISTIFAFCTALDPVSMQPGKVSSESADEALFFNHFPFGTDIRQTGQVSGVAKRNPAKTSERVHLRAN